MTYTAFEGIHRVAVGETAEIVKILKRKKQGEILVFDDSTGAQIDLDLRRKPSKLTLLQSSPGARAVRGSA